MCSGEVFLKGGGGYTLGDGGFGILNFFWQVYKIYLVVGGLRDGRLVREKDLRLLFRMGLSRFYINSSVFLFL